MGERPKHSTPEAELRNLLTPFMVAEQLYAELQIDEAEKDAMIRKASYEVWQRLKKPARRAG